MNPNDRRLRQHHSESVGEPRPNDPELSRPGGGRRRGVRFITTLGRCSVCLSRDGDFHVRTGFEADLLALFIRQRVVDAYFSIKMIPAFNGYLCFF